MREIHVGLGNRAYPIMIRSGLLVDIGKDLAGRKIANRFVVIADQQVAELYSVQVMASLTNAGLKATLISFPRGEASKNLNTIADLASKLARLGLDRKDGLIALGGGVTGDITGFLAAIYMRGIPFIQIPTTLLAQVDSSVGGKTGVDIPEGKNLIGCFYQPKAVYIDTNVLQTLPKQELLNGLAEVIKYGVIYDQDFFRFIEEKKEAILQLDLEIMGQVIERCCAIKAEVVAADEKEADLRRILNFGHTIGHAVEAASNFAIAHGKAVAMGMVAAAKLAVQKNMFTADEAQRLSKLISSYSLPIEIPANLNRDEIKSYLKTDKKAVGGRPFFVLPAGIGKVVITDEVDGRVIDKVLG